MNPEPAGDALDWLMDDEEPVGEILSEDVEYTDEQIEDHLRYLAYHTKKFDAYTSQYEMEIERIRLLYDAVSGKHLNAIDHHSQNLTEAGRRRGETFKGLNGTVKKISGRDSLKCETTEEREKFFAWVAETGKVELLRVKPAEQHPDKTKIMKFVKEEGGELPPGIDIETGDDTFKIEIS